ncbi:MAG: hypothetical protein ACRDXX_17025 [Stackebrandtia sp.]
MNDLLESQLREALGERARQTSVDPPPGYADAMLHRGKRVRTQRRVAVAIGAPAMALALGIGIVWLPAMGDSSDGAPAAGGKDDDESAEMVEIAGLSTLVEEDGEDFVRTDDGDMIATGLSDAMAVAQVGGGWVVDGYRDSDKGEENVISFVSLGGDVTELASDEGADGGIWSVANERGDRVAVSETSDDSTVASMYDVGAETVEPLDAVNVPGGDVGGVAADTAWIYSGVDESDGGEPTAEVATSVLQTWTPGEAPVSLGRMSLTPYLPVAEGLVVGDVDDGDDTTWCPRLLDPTSGFTAVAGETCFDDTLSDYVEIVVSPDGTQLLAYMEPYVDDADWEPDAGEWVWLDVESGKTEPTGQTLQYPTPVIAPDGDARYFSEEESDEDLSSRIFPLRAAK